MKERDNWEGRKNESWDVMEIELRRTTLLFGEAFLATIT